MRLAEREARRLSTGLGALLAIVVAGSAEVGCSDTSTDDGSTSSAEAVTVASGYKFVVSTSPNEVILRRKAEGRDFPFTINQLLGKAILIHPVDGKSDGVYGRVLSAREDGAHLVLATHALSLEEMEVLTEDDVVRIFLDPSLDTPRLEKPTMTSAFRSLTPQGWSGLIGGDLDAAGKIELLPGIRLEEAITVTYDGGRLDLAPSLLASYSRDQGLEVGLRASLAWSSSISIRGAAAVRAKFFRTPQVGPPGVWITVPIGIFPVPVRLRLVGSLECEALGQVELDTKITMAMSAHAAGSVRVKPTGDVPSTWVSQGQWPFEVGGSASADVTGTVNPGAGSGFECTLPRVELQTLVAGVAGPYLAVTPKLRRLRSEQGVPEGSIDVALKAGLRGQLFGREAIAEVDLVSWSPKQP
jgi:hypothetical protein